MTTLSDVLLFVAACSREDSVRVRIALDRRSIDKQPPATLDRISDAIRRALTPEALEAALAIEGSPAWMAATRAALDAHEVGDMRVMTAALDSAAEIDAPATTQLRALLASSEAISAATGEAGDR